MAEPPACQQRWSWPAPSAASRSWTRASPATRPAQHLQGFLSRDGLPPAELLRLGREEVTGYGADIVAGEWSDVRRTSERRARASTSSFADGDALCARDGVLVATGLRDVLPDIPGVRERWGRDLLHCPYCHGYEVRDQPLGVIGATPEAVMHAHLVRQWSPDVVLFTHTDRPEPTGRPRALVARAIGVVDGPVAGLVVEDDKLTGVELADGRVVRRAAVFVRPRMVPDNDPAGRPRLRDRRQRLGRRRPHRPHQRPRRLGGRQRRQPARPGHHRRRRGLVRRDRPQRRPRRRGRRRGGARDFRSPDPESQPNQRRTPMSVPPPSKHQLALMIWLAVFPTLVVLNLTLGRALGDLAVVPRTFVLATVAVPIVIYGLMPHLHRLRARLLTSR